LFTSKVSACPEKSVCHSVGSARQNLQQKHTQTISLKYHLFKLQKVYTTNTTCLIRLCNCFLCSIFVRSQLSVQGKDLEIWKNSVLRLLTIYVVSTTNISYFSIISQVPEVFDTSKKVHKIILKKKVKLNMWCGFWWCCDAQDWETVFHILIMRKNMKYCSSIQSQDPSIFNTSI